MKKSKFIFNRKLPQKISFQMLLFLFFASFISMTQAQYNFPDCSPAWDISQIPYVQGKEVSYEGLNYRAKYSTNDAPSTSTWDILGPCGDGGLGPNYSGKQRIIGYLPTWVADYDIKNKFNPEVVTNLNISFLMFKQNNNDYNSANFASISFDEFQARKVDSVLNDLGVLQKAKAKGVKVAVALGGATDFAFLWLMNKYHNDDAKLDQIATLIANYVIQNDLDGIDLDMECWWADPAISGTTDQGGRIRGDKWGGTDQGPHPAGIGLTKLSQKLRAKIPNKLITAAVFGTSWYGNNYDDGIADYMDWVGLMSYDFTGSWDKSPEGPHSSLYKVEQAYTGQTIDNPIYSAQDALEYWMGFAPPAWNHAGGFKVPKSKLVFGLPVYGYDFSEKKPNGGNGAKFVPYKDIVKDFPNAATNYDPKDSKKLRGYIGENGKKIYYNTPKLAGEKIKYSKQYGHQGLIVWELTQDTDYNEPSSIMKAVNEAAGNTTPINSVPVITWETPTSNQVIKMTTFTNIPLKVKATDSDGTVTSFGFKYNNTEISATKNGDYYTANFLPTAYGEVSIVASATDDKNGTAEQIISFTVKEKIEGENLPPIVSITSPANNASVAVGVETTLSATATDSDGTIASVVFQINGANVQTTKNGDTYTAKWTGSQAGTYTFKVVATDNDNLSSEKQVSYTVTTDTGPDNCINFAEWSASETYRVGNDVKYKNIHYQAKWWTQNENPETKSGPSDVWKKIGPCNGSENPNIRPTAAITSPNANATFYTGASITIAATASDSDGTVAKVEFYNGTVRLGEDTTSPYSFIINNAAKGNYTLSAKATDNKGASTTSSTVAVIVKDKIPDGGTCDGLPQYAAGTTYVKDQEVQNEKQKFRCNIPGWCSSTAAWAYAPGTGAHWTDAWTKVGDCATTGKFSSNQKVIGGVSTYPNPILDNIMRLNVETVQDNASFRLQIFNINGIKVLDVENVKIQKGNNNKSFDVSSLKAGMYFYTISAPREKVYGKLMKQ